MSRPKLYRAAGDEHAHVLTESRLRAIAAFGFGLMVKVDDYEVRMLASRLLDLQGYVEADNAGT